MFLILYHIDPIYQNRSILVREKLLENLNKKKFDIKNFSEKHINNFLKVIENLKVEIEKDLEPIILSENLKNLINDDFDKISKYLYEICFEKRDFDNKFLKFLLLLNEKYHNNHELSFLIRFLMDKFESEIFFKILLYNRLLTEIYYKCSFSNYDFFFHNPNFNKYRKKFQNLLMILNKQTSEFYKHAYAYKDYELKFNTEDAVAPILKQISYCYFFDKFKKKSGYSLNDEKSMKIIRQELKDKYIGAEKWLNQYNLYKNTKILFKNSDIKIFREFSPASMGKQRLDVYFEIGNQKVGFEYQGEQHYKSVDFFGGEEGFKKRQQLDKRKKNICKKLNIKLIKFKFTESVSINAIISKMIRKNIEFTDKNIF